jgi:DNA polymerase
MFVGEGPGEEEDRQGRPFVGRAGQKLNEMISAMGLRREQVYIANVVKCRPPGNRDPLPEETEACSVFLDRQIRALNPKLIVTLGRFSLARFLPNARISAVHGQARTANGRLVVPMYHPAAALHQPSLRRSVEEDFARLPEMIQRAQDVKPAEAEPPAQPQQLNLF